MVDRHLKADNFRPQKNKCDEFGKKRQRRLFCVKYISGKTITHFVELRNSNDLDEPNRKKKLEPKSWSVSIKETNPKS